MKSNPTRSLRATLARHAEVGGALLVATGACLVSLAARPAPQEPGGEVVDEARARLERWVDVRRTIAKEKRDWAVGREVLEEQVELVRGEIEAMRERIAEADKTATDTDRERAKLAAEHDLLKQSSDLLAEAVVGLEERTLVLLKRLPDPIAETVRAVSQRIPEDPESSKLSIGDRFLNVVYVIKEVNKFNQVITVSSEVRSLGDGQSAEVTAMYVGIGQGYFVSADETSAGVGRAGESGWEWTPADEHAAAIAEAIAIQSNEKEAGYVRLPLTIGQ